jgi:hypothetical protein
MNNNTEMTLTQDDQKLITQLVAPVTELDTPEQVILWALQILYNLNNVVYIRRPI